MIDIENLVVNPQFPQYLISRDGKVYTKYHSSDWKEMKPFKNNCHMGYMRISLIDSEGKRRKIHIHRLIAETFIPNPQHLKCVNHKDENVMNNSVSNLEWCSHAYNNSYGNHLKNCKKGLEKSLEIKRKPVVGVDTVGNEFYFSSLSEAGQKTGTFASNIYKCLKGERKRTGGFQWKIIQTK